MQRNRRPRSADRRVLLLSVVDCTVRTVGRLRSAAALVSPLIPQFAAVPIAVASAQTTCGSVGLAAERPIAPERALVVRRGPVGMPTKAGRPREWLDDDRWPAGPTPLQPIRLTKSTMGQGAADSRCGNTLADSVNPLVRPGTRCVGHRRSIAAATANVDSLEGRPGWPSRRPARRAKGNRSGRVDRRRPAERVAAAPGPCLADRSGCVSGDDGERQVTGHAARRQRRGKGECHD
jgi:hypothetical protein